MDNLCVHKGKWVRELERLPAVAPSQLLSGSQPHRGSFLHFLQSEDPPQEGEARTLEGLFEATAQALCAISADDARGYFDHCGYVKTQDHPLSQPL
jgi:hypothetical protein